MTSLLDKIVDRKPKKLALQRAGVPTAGARGEARGGVARAGFCAAVSRPAAVNLIAEFKRKSPSAGEIRPGATIEEVVRGYEAAGASAAIRCSPTAGISAAA
jgi:indole-3-glycerol phosphate synthase